MCGSGEELSELELRSGASVSARCAAVPWKGSWRCSTDMGLPVGLSAARPLSGSALK